MRRFRIPPSTTGVSMLEVFIATTILAMVMLAVGNLFNVTQRGFSNAEAHMALKTGGQQVMGIIGQSLSQSKRLFENTTASDAYRQRAHLVTAPAPLTGSKLPLIMENGSLSTTSSLFVSSSVGNSLFMASLQESRDVVVPLIGVPPSISLRIDLYSFSYYYLAEDTSQRVGSQAKIVLWNWTSQRYADYDQINSMTDAAAKTKLVQILLSSGITCAWNAAADVSSAFYTLQANGSMLLTPGHQIEEAQAAPVIKLLSGTMSTGFRYGISPNSALAGLTTPDVVPRFAAPSGKYPSGFEVAVVGPAGQRQIFMRIVFVGGGSFKGLISNEHVLLLTVRDLW